MRDVPKRMLPPKLTLRSGFCGNKGKRVQRPPRPFPFQPPSSADLGIADDVDTSNWPLHVKGNPRLEQTGETLDRFPFEAEIGRTKRNLN
jgi:hypothetical protein